MEIGVAADDYFQNHDGGSSEGRLTIDKHEVSVQHAAQNLVALSEFDVLLLLHLNFLSRRKTNGVNVWVVRVIFNHHL